MSYRPSYNEKRYFVTGQMQARENLRSRVNDAAERAQGPVSVGSTLQGQATAGVVERIKALGFDGDSARVFDLVPLIHVSWADGKIQPDERAAILAILEKRGIEPESEACLIIECLLEKEPSRAFFDESLACLRALTHRNQDQAADVVDLCIQVAEASGGVLGMGSKISIDERALIQQVADLLGAGAQKKFKERLGG